jgi:hypothetical protein
MRASLDMTVPACTIMRHGQQGRATMGYRRLAPSKHTDSVGVSSLSAIKPTTAP